MTRIAMFMDGNFFMTVTEYYRFNHTVERYLSFRGLAQFVRDRVAQLEDIEPRYCQVIESHWFRGRYNTTQVGQMITDEEKRLKWLTNERYRDDLFMYNDITQHVFPLHYDSNTGRTTEKGIDVWLALEAFELSVLKGLDVLVLIAGDTDYVPLIRKLTARGTRVMILGWDFEYEYGDGKINTTRTSQALLDESTYPVDMDAIVDDMANNTNPAVHALFDG